MSTLDSSLKKIFCYFTIFLFHFVISLKEDLTKWKCPRVGESQLPNGADHKPAGSCSIAKCNHHRLGSPVRRGCSTPPCCRSVPASVAFENIFTQFRFRLVIFTGSVVHSGTGARATCFMRAPSMTCTLSKLKLSPHQFTSSNNARGKAILPYRSAARRGAVTCDCLRLKPRAMAICSSDT